MLIAANGDYAGLLSGGCLEGDLREHARSVIETGEPRIVSYDMRGPEDLLWGLGLGCEGAMQILLLRAGPDRDWQPLTHLARALAGHAPTAIGIVTESARPDLPAGTIALPLRAGADAAPQAQAPLGGQSVQAALADAVRSGHVSWVEGESPPWKVFVLPLSLPPRLLLLGAGPDAAPVVDFAARLNWKVTLVDHRPAYAQVSHFPLAERVILARPDDLSGVLDLAGYSAAEVEARFGGMLKAFRYGAPPHGGSAPGIDRIVMLLADTPNIREIVAFPMNQQAQDLLMQAPAPVPPERLRELHIRLDLPPAKPPR